MFTSPLKVVRTVRSGFYGVRALVVGDLILDRYLWGQVERISPEAPVPIVHLDHKSHAAGGAANVAANLSALGCTVTVAGVLGTDEDGRQLLELMQAAGVDTKPVLQTGDRPTICKTRIFGGRQQMLRFDVEKVTPLSPGSRRHFLAQTEELIPDISVVILSDYGKGVLDYSICQVVIRRARELSVPVLVDPKGVNYEKYRGCSLISPNRKELAAAVSTDPGDLELLLHKGQTLRSGLNVRHLAVTLGDLGMALLDETGIHRFPALAREVFDVSGAGDTAISTMSAAVAAGLHLHDAIRLANLAAGIVIRKVGTVAVNRDELVASLTSDEKATEKVCTLDALSARVVRWRASGQRIVFTNGCFDLFHVGHLSLLEQAKRMGDCLVVALNTDRSVRALKGITRPIISEESRARLVAALPCVDAVVLFDEETPLDLIRAVRPDVLVKGGDYTEDQVVGANEVKGWGGKVALVPLAEGFSTTAILKRALLSSQHSPQQVIY